MAGWVHEVLFEGGAQPLVHAPRGRVTAATVQIEDLTVDEESDDRFILANEAATIDVYNVELTAAAGRGEVDPRLMTHAGDSATVGRTYALEATDGRYELFVAEAVSATTVRSRTPLSASYAAGARIRGVQLTTSFPELAAADEDLFDGDPPLRVRWSYTLEERLRRPGELIRLVRERPEDRGGGGLETWLRTMWPELVLAYSDQPNGVRDLVAGVESRLLAKLKNRDVDPVGFLVGSPFGELLGQACVLQLADNGFAPRSRDAEKFRDEQEEEFKRLWMGLVAGRSAHGAADVDRHRDTAAPGSSTKVRNLFVRG